MKDRIECKNIITNEIIDIANSLKLSKEIVALLFARGFDSIEKIKDFLSPSIDKMVPPTVISHINDAVERIRYAVDNQEKILIYGDYDCDGICAISILKLYFEKLGVECNHFIPIRSEGYGLSQSTLEKIADDFCPDLIITVDCGITSIEEVDFCREVLGIDIIVTDHHEPYEELPDCIIVNPKIGGDNNPLHDLCGAGVALKLVEALSSKDEALEYIDIACLATIADIVPLLGENRIIASVGLAKLNKKERLGLKLLANSASIEKITAVDIGFKLGPRINSAGRLGDATDIVSLFTSKEHFELDVIVNSLNAANQKRQQLTQKVYKDCLEYLKNYDLMNNRIIILNDSTWENGILGVVAARIANEFNRPTILFNSKTEFFKGSARSIPGINIFECISAAGDLLTNYGGHYGAAGLTCNTSNYGEFKRIVEEYLEKTYPIDLYLPKTSYDILVDKKMLNNKFAHQLEKLEPTGESNPTPILALSLPSINPQYLPYGNLIKASLNDETDIISFKNLFLTKERDMNVDALLFGIAGCRVYANRSYTQMTVNDVVIRDISTLEDSDESFISYLKTLLYPKADVLFRAINDDEVLDPDGIYGNIYVAYSAETAKSFIEKTKSYPNIISSIDVSECSLNPINRLLISPDNIEVFTYYERLVFLDAPLSTGYVKEISKICDGEIVYRKNYAFLDKIKKVDLNPEKIKDTYSFLKKYLSIGNQAQGIIDMYHKMTKHGYIQNIESYIAHFLSFYEVGLLKIKDKFTVNIASNYLFDIEASRVSKTLKILQKM